MDAWLLAEFHDQAIGEWSFIHDAAEAARGAAQVSLKQQSADQLRNLHAIDEASVADMHAMTEVKVAVDGAAREEAARVRKGLSIEHGGESEWEDVDIRGYPGAGG